MLEVLQIQLPSHVTEHTRVEDNSIGVETNALA